MSYEVELKNAKIFIARKFHKELLAKLVKKMPKLNPLYYQPSSGFPPVRRANLAEELTYWHFEAQLDGDYNIIGLRMTANFLSGDEDDLFKILAPCVTPGDEIVVKGEDGVRYKWKFDGLRVKKLVSKVMKTETEFAEVES